MTEAGFASDLGAEKFFDIKCRTGGLTPSAAVIVATVRALKLHGGVALDDLGARGRGRRAARPENLAKHVENVRPVRRAAGRRAQPLHGRHRGRGRRPCWTPAAAGACRRAISRGWERAAPAPRSWPRRCSTRSTRRSHRLPPALSRRVAARAEDRDDRHEGLRRRRRHVRARGRGQARALARRSATGALPICMAKTQNSLSDDPKKLGRPRGFTVTVRDAKLAAGAGFVVAYAGDILTMPGLPKVPGRRADRRRRRRQRGGVVLVGIIRERRRAGVGAGGGARGRRGGPSALGGEPYRGR